MQSSETANGRKYRLRRQPDFMRIHEIPATWGLCARALARYHAGGIDGIGYVFTTDDPFTGIDLEDMDDDARAIVAALASYTEESPSGRGVHAIVEAAKPGTRCRVGTVEMCDQGRFFAITGRRVPGTPATIEPRQAELDRLYARLFPDPSPRPPMVQSTPIAGDAALIEKASAAKNGAKFRRLMAGDWTGYKSQSEGDAALCALLRHWGADDAQIDSIFRRSGLMRDKWERTDYRQNTMYPNECSLMHSGAIVNKCVRTCALRQAPHASLAH